jgi:hypothetical protein
VAVQAILDRPTTQVFGKQLHAVQHIRKMRGGAQAQLMRASNDQFVVVKFRDNPQHVRVLANELFASRLGQRLGLPMPDVETIEVSDWLIQHTPELRLEVAGRSVPFSSGLHLASHYAADIEFTSVFDYLPESLFPKVLNRSDLARSLVLDKWTGNADGRQAVFIQLPRRAGYSLRLIDQGFCFNAGEWTFPDLSLQGVYYRNHAYQGVTSWESFEPALTGAEQMDMADLWNCAAGIPSEWCSPAPDDLPGLVESLYHRRSKIRDLISAFRDSSRNPFPNWIDD